MRHRNRELYRSWVFSLFAQVGLAYAFRRGLEQGVPELSEQAFQQAISQVGMQYNPSDVRRVFDSFDHTAGDHTAQHI